jgi:hypothetical protein
MNNVMLGKKELVVIVVVLVLCCIYFIIEYFLNRNTDKKQPNKILENFADGETTSGETTAASQNINQHELDEIKATNEKIFTDMKKVNDNKKALVENEILLAKRFKSKKFDLKHIIATSRTEKGETERSELSFKFKALIGYYEEDKLPGNGRSKYLDEIVSYLSSAIENIPTDGDIDSTKRSEQLYTYMKAILESEENIYTDMNKYHQDTAVLDLQKILDTLNKKNDGSDELDVSDLRTQLEISEEAFKTNIEKIENDGNELLKYLSNDTNINRNVSKLLVELYDNKLKLLRKLSVRRIGFNLPDMIVTLALIGNLKISKGKLTSTEESEFIKEQENSITESNKIANEIISLYDKEEDILKQISNFFNTSKSSFFIEENEFKYFNTVDNNTNTMLKFCKKIRKMDRPKNNTLLFKRLTGEFINKKNEQINTLNGKIDGIMNEMTLKDNYKQDLYKLRTSEDAQKQINAIEKAKENIENMGKVKINVT